MQQVMRNLVNNAVKYGGEDKTVIISVHRNNKVIRFEVTDHGQGIPEDQLSLIWNRYYKVDRNNTRSYDGSGLGLSIVKTILQLHNVNYGVSSKVGEGTTFYFEFPKCEH
jgi:signal transduction histidine kinase